jgi:hypothetical protein
MTNPLAPDRQEVTRLVSGMLVLSALVEWRHQRGPGPRCLGRLLSGAPGGVVGVLSEVRGNPAGCGVSADPAGAADALIAGAGSAEGFGAVDPAAVSWILHHGSFSAFDNPAAPETFTLAGGMRWDGRFYTDDLDGHRLLSAAEAVALLGGGLEPVADVLARLGWRP